MWITSLFLNLEWCRSGHNGADSKSVSPKGREGSNPFFTKNKLYTAPCTVYSLFGFVSGFAGCSAPYISLRSINSLKKPHWGFFYVRTVLKEIITASADIKRLGTMYRVFFVCRKPFKHSNLNRNNLRPERWINDSAVGRGVKTPLFYAHNIEKDGRYSYNYKQLLQRKNLNISE